MSLSDRYANFPRISDRADWQTPVALYHEDRMVEAFEAAEGVGLGHAGRYLSWYRMIEAEYLTRERAEIGEVNPWLSVEVIDEEVGDYRADLLAAAASEFDDVADRLDYRHESVVRLAVMAIESDAPWTDGRFGFCVKKTPYFKICIPNSLMTAPEELARTLRHEYAHVVTGTLSAGRVPRWLDEAVAMVMEGGVGGEARAAFRRGKRAWLSPGELAGAYLGAGAGAALWYAYQQSGLIGEFLAESYGEPKLGDLLRAFSNNSLWTDLMLVVRGEPPVGEALQETYGMTEPELFSAAWEWVRQAA